VSVAASNFHVEVVCVLQECANFHVEVNANTHPRRKKAPTPKGEGQ
jgi:hypothetical protein